MNIPLSIYSSREYMSCMGSSDPKAKNKSHSPRVSAALVDHTYQCNTVHVQAFALILSQRVREAWSVR